MTARGHRRTLLTLVATSLVLVSCNSGDRPDPGFSTKVARPAYTIDGPHVAFDEGHNNWHKARGTYRPFVELIESDGYRVTRSLSSIDLQSLREKAILVVVTATGTNERNDDSAFADAECEAISDWVQQGGGLLLITDHYPMGHAAESLGSRFGVEMSKGVVEDSVQWDRSFEETHLVFSRENGGIGEHPILEGADTSERVARVLTFTGQALAGGPDAVPLLRLSPTAVARRAEPLVVRDGGDVRVNVSYGEASPAEGMSQALALQIGEGRVVVLGEAAMLTALLRKGDGKSIGMGVAGYDNRQLALNIMHWLSKKL